MLPAILTSTLLTIYLLRVTFAHLASAARFAIFRRCSAVKVARPRPARLSTNLLDDQAELAELIQTVLEEDGHSVEAVHGGQAALERIARREYDLVLCDLQTPDVDGAAVYREVQR